MWYIMRFRGIHPASVDEKGRIGIPARYRADIILESGGMVMLTIEPDGCLLLYPMHHWEELELKLSHLPDFDPATKAWQRLLIGHATEASLDKSGRILIPQPLREYAGLERQVVLLGQINKFELWSQNLFATERERWLRNIRPSPDIIERH